MIYVYEHERNYGNISVIPFFFPPESQSYLLLLRQIYDNPQINLPKRWLIQKLFFSLLRIDGPLVSRFDYKVFTSVTKRICKLSVVLIFLLVTIYPESFIHLFIFYHFHYEHLCWKP